MANNFSDNLESGLLNFLLRGYTFSPSGVLGIGLTTNIPVDASTGSNASEVANAFGYARVPYNSNQTNWSLDDRAVNTSYNNSGIVFTATAGGDFGNISGIIIADTTIYGAGNIYFWGALTTPKYIGALDSLTVPISGLSVQLN